MCVCACVCVLRVFERARESEKESEREGERGRDGVEKIRILCIVSPLKLNNAKRVQILLAKTTLTPLL